MGGKSTTSTQTIQIPPEVMARYKAINERAEKVASQPFQKYTGELVAGLTDQQKAGMADVNAAAGMAQPYYNQAADYTKAGAQSVGKLTADQIAQYQNPYTQSVIDPTIKALRQQQGQDLAQQQAQAIKSGGFGGDRAGIARATTMGQQDLARAMTESGLRSKAYDQAVQTAMNQQGVAASDLERQMKAGTQFANLGSGAQAAALEGAKAKIGAGTLEQQTKQADLTAQYQQYLQELGFPYQQAQFLANIAIGTGQNSGSTTTTTQPGGFFSSDERLKENIEPIGETFDGQPIYRYNYKGEPATQIGLMAQDVLDRGKPGVAHDKAGYLMLNYHDATDDAAAMASMGGVVTEPGEYARGGNVSSGLIPLDDLGAILQSQAQSFGPFSAAGLSGERGAGVGTPGLTGIIPPPTVQTSRMVTAGPLPQQQSSGASQAMSIGKGVADLYSAGKSLKSEFMPSDLEKAAKLEKEEKLKPFLERVRGSNARGGLIPHYADGGAANDDDNVLPYGQDSMSGNQDILGDVLKAGTPSSQGLQKPGDLPRQRSGMENVKDVASVASSIASIASMLPFSDERLKHNIEPVGQTFDGQNIYRYDMGDGRTKIGLMAQEVLQRRPDAVGERDGYLTLDYDRATEDAASPFAYGGVVPRQGYADGDKVEEPTLEDPTMGLIAKFEGFRERPYWDVNANRVGFGSDTITLPSGEVKRVTPETTVSVEDARRDLARRSREFAQSAQRSVGDEQWNALDPQARAALTSVTYNYGTLPKSVAEAARSGDRAGLASAVNALGTHNEGINARRRSQEAGLIDPQGKYDPVVGRPTPPGLIGRSDADKPAPRAKEAQFRSEEPGLLSSLGEKATSERYLVPALSFLGSMLASKSPFLGGAIGEGLVGGVAGYQSMQKQQMEMGKNIVDMVGNRFERVLVGNPPQVTYRNKLTGDTYRPDQMGSMVYGALKSAGIPPEMWGVAKPILGGISAPPAAGAQPEKGAESVAAAPVAGAAPAAGEPAKAPATQKAIEDMSKGELKLYFEKNPAAAGFEPNDPNNPQILRRNIIANQQREQAAIEAGLTDEAAKAQAQVKEDQARLRDVLNDAAEMQAKLNEKRGELTTVRADQYLAGIAPRLERVRTLQAEMSRLGDIYAENLTTGRAEDFKAALAQWADGLGASGLPIPGLKDKIEKMKINANNFDEAVKITMDQVYKTVTAEGLVRAPAASAAGLSKTTPGPTLGPGAVYSLIGRVIGESEHIRKRDEAYLDQRPGTDPTRFVRDYERQDPYAIKKEIARGLSMVPIPKDSSIRAQIDSLARTYEPYGFRPMGMEGAASQQAQPVTSGTVNNVPFKVVQ